MDNTSIVDDTALWGQTITRVHQELANLPADQRDWLARQAERIGTLQGELDRLFRAVGGPTICTDCLGGCCSHAKHHLTLTNVLAYLLAGEEPPQPDFTLICPMLGPCGCQLPVTHRPFNCIIFLCEAVDRKLTAEQCAVFASVEAELRSAYQAVADRCPGASLHGLLIAASRLESQPLLSQVGRG